MLSASVGGIQERSPHVCLVSTLGIMSYPLADSVSSEKGHHLPSTGLGWGSPGAQLLTEDQLGMLWVSAHSDCEAECLHNFSY